jgi:hypothetical protein
MYLHYLPLRSLITHVNSLVYLFSQFYALDRRRQEEEKDNISVQCNALDNCCSDPK